MKKHNDVNIILTANAARQGNKEAEDRHSGRNQEPNSCDGEGTSEPYTPVYD